MLVRKILDCFRFTRVSFFGKECQNSSHDYNAKAMQHLACVGRERKHGEGAERAQRGRGERGQSAGRKLGYRGGERKDT